MQKKTRPCFVVLGGEDKWLQSQLEIIRAVMFVEVCYTFGSGFSSLHQNKSGWWPGRCEHHWLVQSISFLGFLLVFISFWMILSISPTWDAVLPDSSSRTVHMTKNIREVYSSAVLPEVGESFPYHYQNHYQKQWASDLQHTNQVRKDGIEPPIFLTFLGDCPGQWRLMSGPLGSMFRESKWSEFARWNVQYMLFFSKPWRWKMPLSSCT